MRRTLLVAALTALAALLPAAPAAAGVHYFRLSVEGSQTTTTTLTERCEQGTVVGRASDRFTFRTTRPTRMLALIGRRSNGRPILVFDVARAALIYPRTAGEITRESDLPPPEQSLCRPDPESGPRDCGTKAFSSLSLTFQGFMQRRRPRVTLISGLTTPKDPFSNCRAPGFPQILDSHATVSLRRLAGRERRIEISGRKTTTNRRDDDEFTVQETVQTVNWRATLIRIRR